MPRVAPSCGSGTFESSETPSRLGGDSREEVSDALVIEDVHDVVEDYLVSQVPGHLEIVEVMAFEQNFYAIAREPTTGTGAMEILVDRETGIVGPEMGPNMRWKARYGMQRRGMMDNSNEKIMISEAEATAAAQRWLDEKRPGITVEEYAEPFYGHYTLHTVQGVQPQPGYNLHQSRSWELLSRLVKAHNAHYWSPLPGQAVCPQVRLGRGLRRCRPRSPE